MISLLECLVLIHAVSKTKSDLNSIGDRRRDIETLAAHKATPRPPFRCMHNAEQRQRRYPLYHGTFVESVNRHRADSRYLSLCVGVLSWPLPRPTCLAIETEAPSKMLESR